MEPFVLFVVIAGAVALGYVLGQLAMTVWYAVEQAVQRRRWEAHRVEMTLNLTEPPTRRGDRWEPA